MFPCYRHQRRPDFHANLLFCWEPFLQTDLHKTTGKLNGLDLFAGIGGISLALQPWVRTVCYVEIESFPQRVIQKQIKAGNLDDAPIWDDVRTFDPRPWSSAVDIISGGFPCQDISAAGKGAGLGGEQSGLFWEIIRIAGEIRPQFIFLENVPAITSESKGGADVVGAITALGYDCRWGMLSASEMGAPHKRNRWWLLAHAQSEPQRESADQADPHGSGRGKAQPGGEDERRESYADISGIRETKLSNTDKQHDNDGGYGASPVCREFEIPPGIFRSDWWAAEPDVGRVVDGVSTHMDCIGGIPIESAPKAIKGKTAAGRIHRLKGLGNAVVPACTREAFGRLIGNLSQIQGCLSETAEQATPPAAEKGCGGGKCR